MTISRKMGIGTFGQYRPCVLGNPTVIKATDPSIEDVAALRAENPTSLIDVRWYEAEQPLDEPEVRANQWFSKHYAAMSAMMAYAPVAFEGYNEIADSDAVAYARFEVKRLQLMHSAKFSSIVLNSSVGCPDIPVWPTYKPVIDEMAPYDYYGEHNYWSDTEDIHNPWHVGRFALPQVAPYLVGKKVIITEWGRDYMQDTKKGQAGWKLTCNAETMLGDIRIAGGVYDRYPQVVGTAGFQMGSPNPAQWDNFDLSSLWPRVVSEYPAESTEPVEEPEPVTLPIDGRYLSVDEFREYVKTIDLSGMQRVCIHHTAAPDVATWDKYGGWDYWKNSLQSFYESKGWTKGPHLFVDQNGVGLFYDLTKDGRAVGGGSLEVGTRHIEIVGNFMKSLPDDDRLDIAAQVAATILDSAGLEVSDDTLTYHQKLVQNATYECPGAMLIAQWVWFASMVSDKWSALQPEPEMPYLPEYVEANVTDPATVLEKTRWWLEEMQRKYESGETEKAEAIRLSLITWMYSREEILKT